MSVYFIGVDLAWSSKRKTGVASGVGNEEGMIVKEVSLLKEDGEIVDFIKNRCKKGHVFVAIDAPLIVPNERGKRRAEEEIQKVFHREKAVAHPSNRKRLISTCGRIRGEDLVNMLKSIGMEHSPFIKRFERAKKFFEVFPHPAIVKIFGLNEIIKYKQKKGRDKEFLERELERYKHLLLSLKDARPPMYIREHILERIENLGRKDKEDVLDAIMCSYIAYYCWYNPERCTLFGNMEEGYILTPS